MGELEVCSEGLHALAAQCSAAAARLAGDVSTGVVGPPHQATTTAVGEAYTAIRATAVVFADRVQATGDKLAVAAAKYMSSDEASAERLSALRIEPNQL